MHCLIHSTLLGDPTVRKGLLKADLIVPSLDAVDLEIFKRIDRPHAGIKLNEIISGNYNRLSPRNLLGKIWINILHNMFS